MVYFISCKFNLNLKKKNVYRVKTSWFDPTLTRAENILATLLHQWKRIGPDFAATDWGLCAQLGWAICFCMPLKLQSRPGSVSCWHHPQIGTSVFLPELPWKLPSSACSSVSGTSYLILVSFLPGAGSCTWDLSCWMKLCCHWIIPLDMCHSWPSRNPYHLDSTCLMIGPKVSESPEANVLPFSHGIGLSKCSQESAS